MFAVWRAKEETRREREGGGGGGGEGGREREREEEETGIKETLHTPHVAYTCRYLHVHMYNVSVQSPDLMQSLD